MNILKRDLFPVSVSCVKKIESDPNYLLRVGLAALFASLVMFMPDALAARTVTSATLNGASSVTVVPSSTITAVVNVTTDGGGSAARWRSTGWRIATTAPGTVTCVNHPNHDSAGAYSESFSIAAPAGVGTYNAYFIAYNNDTCSGSPSATFTMTGAVIIDATNPIPATTGISPTSATVNAAAFTLTVTGASFVPTSVVRFAGSNRTTTYVSSTQLTAAIPASDLTTLGTFNITVFNPTPGGGISNAQTFTVSAAPPAATTNAASGITAWAATANGTVSSNGAITTITFEYGLTIAYGASITATQSPLAADAAANTPVSASLTGLSCNKTYHYRVKATSSSGTTNGLDKAFTTATCSGTYPATACAATRYGSDLVCTANDVSLLSVAIAPGSQPSCVSGATITADLDFEVKFATPDRFDIGIFIPSDGKSPALLPTSGGAQSCRVAILPLTLPFLDLDGVPQGTVDSCGDGNKDINNGTGAGIVRVTGVTLPCKADSLSGGKIYVPFALTWDSQKSPSGNLCTSNQNPVPSSPSKCNVPSSLYPINVQVLPRITKTNGGTTINRGTATVYAVTITNDTGGALTNAVFKDPAVTNPLTPLTVNSVSCAATGGATCPATPTVAAMQGTGITLSSMPNNSSVTFTIGATLSSSATLGQTLVNMATVTVGAYSNSATDSDDIVLAPAAIKSFAPSTISESAASLLTITLTNPGTSNITNVAFTDTYPASMVNTASAGGTTTCGGTVTAANNGTSVALSGGTIPAQGSCKVTVYVTSAIPGSYTNSTGTITINNGTLPAASAILTVSVAEFGSFNACDVAAIPNASCTNTTTVTNSHIATKIADLPFNLDIVALKTDGTRNTSYNNDVIVQLLNASNNNGALDANNCRSTWTVIATLSPNPQFAPAQNGLITVGPFWVPEAYRDVRVKVMNSGGVSRIGCSTNNFAIRPSLLAMSATDTDWQTSGISRTLDNISAASPGCSDIGIPTGCTGAIHKAGQFFTVTATAINASFDITENYAETLALNVTNCSPAGTACASPGIFAPGTASFVSGEFISNTATHSEVGAFNLSLQDTNFALVDADDTAASCAGYYVCGTTPVGRFVPDHFDTAVIATATLPMPCPTGLICPAAYNGFVYSGQSFSMTVTARNASGGTTVNYSTATGLAKTTALTPWGALGTTTAPSGFGSLDIDFVTAFAAGTVTETIQQYVFTEALTAPTDVYIRAVDSDAVSSVRTNPMSSVEGGVKVVSGRAKVSNAHGSELLGLPMTATVQYYDGANWTTSLTDNVTTLTLGLSNYQCKTGCAWTTTMTPSGGQITAGVLSLNLSKPSGGGTGSVDLSITAPDYLLESSNELNINPSISGRATFGVYKGNSEFIYLRESY